MTKEEFITIGIRAIGLFLTLCTFLIAIKFITQLYLYFNVHLPMPGDQTTF